MAIYSRLAFKDHIYIILVKIIKKVSDSLSFLNVAIYSRLAFKNHIYIILIPIHLNWVTISCSKNNKIEKTDIECGTYAGSKHAIMLHSIVPVY